MKYFLLFLTACLLLGCTSRDDGKKQFLLQGAWTLRQMDYPVGRTETYTETDGTILRLYDGDSVVYHCAKDCPFGHRSCTGPRHKHHQHCAQPTL